MPRFVLCSMALTLSPIAYGQASEQDALGSQKLFGDNLQEAEPQTNQKEKKPPQPKLSAIDEGRRHFRKGVRLYRRGASDAALAEFARAYQVAPNFRILYNLAQVQAQRQMYVEALIFFRRYLEEATAPISARRRRSVAADQKELLGLIGRLRVLKPISIGTAAFDDSKFNSEFNSELEPEIEAGARVEADADARNKTPTEVMLFVDGVSRGSVSLDSPVLLNAGLHQVRVEAKGYRSQVRTITLLGGEDASFHLMLEAIDLESTDSGGTGKPSVSSPLEPSPKIAIIEDEPKQLAPLNRTPFWVSLSATGALMGATAALGLATHASQRQLNRGLTQFPADRSALDARRNELRLLAQATDMMGLFAVVGVGLTTYLFTSSSTPSGAASPEEKTLTLQAQPHSTGMSLLCTGQF